eukprot:2129743-Amphidinium_carterae.1
MQHGLRGIAACFAACRDEFAYRGTRLIRSETPHAEQPGVEEEPPNAHEPSFNAVHWVPTLNAGMDRYKCLVKKILWRFTLPKQETATIFVVPDLGGMICRNCQCPG